MEKSKVGVILQAGSSLSSKCKQINDVLLENVVKNESDDIVVYLIGEYFAIIDFLQKDQLVMISPLYTTLWDLSLNYNKPNQQSIVYPLQKDSKLSEIESIKSLYYESSVESNVQELLKNNHVDIQLIDCHSLSLDIWNEYCKPLDFGNVEDLHYNHVCLGGTFDCLHPGHRILLTLACLVSDHILIGVTSQDMLKSKMNFEKIKSYDERCATLRKFCTKINPKLNLELYPLHDIYGPAITVEDLDAIVVSLETYKGGYQINEIRKQKGMSPLVILTVNRTSKYNLSSSFIRNHFE